MDRAVCKDTKPIRVVLADDDSATLAAVGELLRPEFEIVALVSDGVALVEAALALRPDVIVSDISMPKLNGFRAATKIRASLPGIKFIFLTMHGTQAYRSKAERVGPAGFVLKSAARRELTATVRNALKPL
jgi:DNA-binding NarL/FixJ family response regulator